MLIAASEMNSRLLLVGASITNTWLMRREVAQAAVLLDDVRQQLVRVHVALHHSADVLRECTMAIARAAASE